MLHQSRMMRASTRSAAASNRAAAVFANQICVLPSPRSRSQVLLRAAAAPAVATSAAQLVSQVGSYLQTQPPGLQAKVQPKQMGERMGLVAQSDVGAGKTIISVPEALAITSIDAEKQELVGSVAASCSELIAMTLWLMAERANSSSSYGAYLATLPASVPTCPLLWSDEELGLQLMGSPVLAEARSRIQALKEQWAALSSTQFADQQKFNPSVFNEQNFFQCFSVVVAYSTYLPSANCFALVPLTSLLSRTGNEEVGCSIDYNASTGTVEVKATKPLKAGQEVRVFDGRPNGELLLATGSVEADNPSDFIYFDASLIAADKYYSMKSQILESLGFSAKESFPVYTNRMPNQLFAYLRLSRVADPALFAKVSFEKDVELSQMNEYEILQILMGDCRERLAAYKLSTEEEVKLLQQQDLTPAQREAAKLRMGEKRLLNSTMDAVRSRLAPIRGIPTKSGGMTDPNQDLVDMFQMIEAIPTAPKKLVEGFMSWARGDDDPDWGAKGRKPPPRK